MNLKSEKPDPEVWHELRHLAAELPVGATDHGRQCPFCRGGRNGDRAFSITRSNEAEAVYCCHRASCGRSGRIAAWGHRLAPGPSSVLPKEFTPKVYSYEVRPMDSAWLSYAYSKYGLAKEEMDWAGWKLSAKDGVLVCPIWDPRQVQRGTELRRWHKDHFGPKTEPYRAKDEPWQSWLRRGDSSSTIVIVEDLISALKVSRHFTVCALLGSHLSQYKAHEIGKEAERLHSPMVVLALDKDAYHKAVKFVKDYYLLIPNFKAVLLSKDLKYCSDDEIKGVING